MKKLTLSLAALLLSFLAYSQEADGLGRYAEVQIIPRIDLNPYFTPGQSGDGTSGLTLGNSSIYTLIEGAFSEHVSFTFSNHWFSIYDPKAPLDVASALYRNTLYSDSNNWVDFANFNFHFGNWDFTVGKENISTGGFEYDKWDVDSHFELASGLWNSLPCYQWGGKVGYTTPSEMTNLTLQMTTSPFGERPFASKLFSYSAQWNGSYGIFSNKWSASAIATAPGSYALLVALGQQVELGSFTLGLDWFNTQGVAYDEDDFAVGMSKGNTFRPSLAFAPSERFDCSLTANLYTSDAFDGLNAGLALHYYPLKESQALRLHCIVACDTFNYGNPTVLFNVGARFNISVLSL